MVQEDSANASALEKICPICSTVFHKSPQKSISNFANRITCSRPCATKHRTALLRKEGPTGRICPICQTPLVRKIRESLEAFTERVTCGIACRNVLLRAPTTFERPCGWCKKPIRVTAKTNNYQHCSPKCRYEHDRDTALARLNEQTEKTCCVCNKVLPETPEFFRWRNRGKPWMGLSSWCIECAKAKTRARYAANPERGRAEASAEARRLRMECLIHYGNGLVACACCGESAVEFLALDHINGGGVAHRKAICKSVSGGNFYRALKRAGFPPLLRILCHNCNLARSFYKRCPHGNID